MTTMTETTMRHTLSTPTDRTIRVERNESRMPGSIVYVAVPGSTSRG